MHDLQIKEYFYQVWKQRRVVAIFVVMTLILTILFTLQQREVYQAVAVIEIGAETPDAMFQDVVNVSPYGWWSALKYYETQYQILKSRSLLEKAAQRVIDRNIMPGRLQDITAHLQGGLSVGSDEKSRLAQVIFDDVEAKRAQILANLIAEVYVDENLAKKLSGMTQAVTWLTDRLAEIRQEKGKQEEVLQKLKEENKIVSVEDRENIAKANLLALSDSLNKIKNQRIEYEAQYQKLHALVKKSKRVEDLLGVVNNEVLLKLKQTLAELQSERSKLAGRYMEKHPTMVRINDEMAAIEKSIRTEVGNEVGRMETKYLLAKSTESQIEKELEKQKLEALKIEEINRKVGDLQVVANTNQQLFESIQKKLKEVDLSSLLRSNNIRIVDKALEPTTPIRPNKKANILLALIVGFLGGVALALTIEYLDDTLKTQDDVERFIQLPVLGVVPHYTTAMANGNGADTAKDIAFVSRDEPTSAVSEFFRTLRTNILFLTASGGKKKLLMVSTGPGEGKTSAVLNLGTSLAQIGQKTLLVELDLRRPRFHSKFQPEDRMGVTNVLVGEATLKDAIHNSGIPNLDYLLSGSIPPNPAELLTSQKLKDLLDEVSHKYDRVIIDSSPIAPVTDAVVLAQIVDGAILVVRAGKTHRKAVRLAIEQLKNVKANIFGVILNGIDIEKSTYGNYQYYKYGYATYGDDQPAAKTPEPSIHA
jgi:polysaccharide biosynthesis transport protein